MWEGPILIIAIISGITLFITLYDKIFGRGEKSGSLAEKVSNAIGALEGFEKN